jgi:hypothetical protein
MTVQEWQEHLAKVGAKATQFAENFIEWLEDYRERGLRDQFAMAALTGNLACETEGFMIRGNDTKTRPQLLAEDAYDIADAMLAAREPKPVDKDPADCAPPLDHGQATDRGEP